MRIIISGGGTGGHIYPAIAIAKIIAEEERDAQILFVGTAEGLESQLVPREGLDFAAIRVRGFRRKLSMDSIKTVIELIKGLADAFKVLREFKPDIVIGTGGYVAGPVVMLAALKGIPTLIHEQNVLPGITNRILARFVDKVAISFKEAADHFNCPGKIVVTGNPIRKELMEKSKEESIEKLGLASNLPLVLVFGGSKGSKRLNDAMAEVISRLYSEKTFQLIHVTGEDRYGEFIKSLEERGIHLKDDGHIKVVPYMYDMPYALSAAELVVTSAGAITLSEITAVGVPAILVPKAYATDNHQEYNARALEKNGAAIVILEKDLEGKNLYRQIKELIKDKKALQYMRKASSSMGKVDAAYRIYKIVKDMAAK